MSRLSTFAGYLSIINLVDNVNWPPERVLKLTFRALAIRQSEFVSQSNELPLIRSLRVAMFTSWRSQKSVRKHLPCYFLLPTQHHKFYRNLPHSFIIFYAIKSTFQIELGVNFPDRSACLD